jgi:hypothetical protein
MTRRVALITGASRGIGAATALVLAERGFGERAGCILRLSGSTRLQDPPDNGRLDRMTAYPVRPEIWASARSIARF